LQVTRQGGFEAAESADGRDLYYSKTMGLADIWRTPVEGGAETLALELRQTGHARAWALGEEGIYFAEAQTPSRSVVNYFSFSTGATTSIATLENPINRGPPGLTVSSDGRWLLYTRIDHIGSDLMLLENFR
jgi:hypothetical protein